MPFTVKQTVRKAVTHRCETRWTPAVSDNLESGRDETVRLSKNLPATTFLLANFIQVLLIGLV